MCGQLQIGLIDITYARRGASANKWRNPVCVRIAQSTRAKGMNVDSNGALDKSKIRPGERAGHLPGVPAIVERTVRHGITVGKNRRGIVIDDGDSNSVKLLRNICQPFVADLIARSGIVRTVDISAPPKAVLLRSDSISNHSSDGGGRRRIQAADQQQRCVFKLTDSAEALKVRIGNRPGNMFKEKSEHGYLGIHRGFIATRDRTCAWVVAWIGRGAWTN